MDKMDQILTQMSDLMDMTSDIMASLGTSAKKTEAMTASLLGMAQSVQQMAESIKTLAEAQTQSTPDADPARPTQKSREPVDQDELLRELAQVVKQLAREKPLRRMRGCTAVNKEDVYTAFERMGYRPHATTKQLAKAKILRSVPDAHNGVTFTCYTPQLKINGKNCRVIIVNGLPEEESV